MTAHRTLSTLCGVMQLRIRIDELADFSGNTVKAVIKEKINQMESEQNFLLEEKSRLEAEIPQLEINPEF